jgi:alpha-L-rhamnosidase
MNVLLFLSGRCRYVVLAGLLLPASLRGQAPALYDLTCEYRRNPLGVDAPAPRLSWKLASARRGARQQAYQIRVADDPRLLARGRGNVWDSGKRVSRQSLQVPYAGQPLRAAQVYYWSVRVWDETGRASAWSAPAHWQMGLLVPGDWGSAQWLGLHQLDSAQRLVPGRHVTHDWARRRPGGPVPAPPLPQFRRRVTSTRPVRRVTAFVASPGHFELFVNGRKVGDQFLDPGWTDFRQYGLYATLDLTPHWTPGTNTLGLMLGNGFYHIPDERYRKLVARHGYPCFIAQLRITYEDGTTEQVVSDASWKGTASPIVFSSIFGGEDYDATKEEPRWQQPDFDDRHWQTPLIVPGVPQLRAQETEPLRIMDTLRVVSVKRLWPQVWVYDLGQNFSGIPRIRVRGATGQTLTLRPAELLTDSGSVTQQAVGTPVLFRYSLRGDGTAEPWQPQFTYYGFRYVQVEGAVPAGQPNPDRLPVVELLEGLHTRNAARTVGSFSCSNPLFNDIHRLIDWSVRSNLASVLTDCPHREKLGWLEVAHLMGGSIQYSYDVAAFFTKVVRDMQAAQLPNGLVPDIAPEFVEFEGGFRDSPEWGSAAIILPWYLYQWYGDHRLLAESYPMMTRYAAYLRGRSRDGLLTHGLGDWFDLGPNAPGESQLTPRGLTATGIYYYDLTILSQVATLLNKPDEARQFAGEAARVRATFQATFRDPLTGRYGTGSQTAQAMALYLNLADSAQRPQVLAHLLADIRERNYALTAGDIGFRYLLRALEDAGASEVIYQMNRRSDVPGYGYQLARGATALTESWPALRFVSNNHCMLGHLTEWFYSGLAGIRQAPGSVGYETLRIEPQFVGDLTQVTARFESPYGPIESAWERTDSLTTVRITIPANASATLRLPPTRRVLEQNRPAERAAGVYGVVQSATATEIRLGAGRYVFSFAGE